MQIFIEFHDSNLSACYIHDNVLLIELGPAYIHKWEVINGKWLGTGCAQNAIIRINNASILKKMPVNPSKISGGMVTFGSTTFDNLISVPLNINNPSRLILHLVSGDTLDISGSSLGITLEGDSKFIENLPEEWAPQTS